MNTARHIASTIPGEEENVVVRKRGRVLHLGSVTKVAAKKPGPSHDPLDQFRTVFE
ncbi:MAG: hypothetical protein HY563_06955, partial [Ignavibacteriales bacterium]|nr:hypothetical protein [Ignavibacteriales bacterium]